MKMSRKIESIQDVVNWGLCIGCGACYYACRKEAITLENVESVGIRPRVNQESCASDCECLSICPGYLVDTSMVSNGLTNEVESNDLFGPVLEIWEGYAADPDLRYAASSGGALSALALYCLEQEHMAFVLHVGIDPLKPWANMTVQSRNKKELLERTGSRYAPASPCDSLQLIEESDDPCVFIGKPCDTTAVSQLRRKRPKLDDNLGLVLTFFCAGTPSTNGTMDLLTRLNIKKNDVNDVRYRGNGWPGSFRVLYEGCKKDASLSYESSWDSLEKYRPFRCHLCADGLGQIADISCGDAWHEYSGNGNVGLSLVLIRTERGREIFHRALDEGYFKATTASVAKVVSAQTNLLGRRKLIFGRFLAMRLFLIPIPIFTGFSLFKAWLRIPIWTKIQTIIGTLRRIIQRGLWRPRSIHSR